MAWLEPLLADRPDLLPVRIEHMQGFSRVGCVAILLCSLLAACSTYHGPITNAPDGEHDIGKPVGPD